MKGVLFYTGLGLLFTHELDEMPNHEWCGIFLLNTLPDDTAMLVFVVAHVTLFALIIGRVASPTPRVRRVSRLVIGASLMVHGVLHALLSGRASYEFTSTLSHMLIFDSAIFGAAYLALATLSGSRPAARKST